MAALRSKAFELKNRKEGARWWCIENLEDRELWNLDGILQRFGMTPMGEIRRCKGPFRWRVFFQSASEPTREKLDDGNWGDTGARIKEAGSPPGTMEVLRRQVQQGR